MPEMEETLVEKINNRNTVTWEWHGSDAVDTWHPHQPISLAKPPEGEKTGGFRSSRQQILSCEFGRQK